MEKNKTGLISELIHLLHFGTHKRGQIYPGHTDPEKIGSGNREGENDN